MTKGTIGIVTLFGLSNYGNRLQNYAVQEIFKTMGYNCKTIVSYEYGLKYIIKFWLKTLLKREWRHFNFYLFNKKYIPLYIVPGSPLLFPKEISKDFTFFVVGSDQVWNPEIRQNQRSNFFLEFADKNQRLTVAPSVAVSEIPEKYYNCFEKGLRGFEFISLREEQSKSVIERLAKKDVEVLIDPTMVISIPQWERIEKREDNLPKKYIVKFFLGDINSNIDRNINLWASKNKCKIINLSEKPWRHVGPDTFLTVIHNASMVFTDSFHGTVFSILYQIPFYVGFRDEIQLNDVNTHTASRITTLLKKFGFEDKILKDNTKITWYGFDFSQSSQRLVEEREKFWNFMTKQLEGLKGNKND